MAAVGVLYIDEVQIGSGPGASITNKTSYTITSTGITTSVSGVQWTYSGSNTFLGFSTTSGATTPDSILEVGDTGTFNDVVWGINGIHLYSVASAPIINPLDTTDLTNTTWYLKQHPNLGSGEYFLNFTSNSTSYVRMRMDGYEFEYGFEEEYEGETFIEYDVVIGSDVETGGTSWSNTSYRTLTITGGSDVTNSTLIAWFKANCVSPLEYITCTDELTDLADAIRAKTSTSSQLTYPSGYISAINGISAKHLTTYGVSIEGPNDIYIDISDIPVGSWNGFSSINVEIEPNIYDGSVTIYTPPSLISFTAYDGNMGRTYSLQAEDGMTWSQWISSEYNSDGFSSQGTSVLYPSHESAVTTSSGGSVTTSSVIIENHAYNYTLW